MANIVKTLPSETERMLHLAYTDLIAFGKMFLPGDFLKSKTPSFHYEIAKELLSPSNKPCAIIIARGHAKTTLVKAKILHDFCFSKKAKEWGFTDKERHYFYGWCSSSQRKSVNNVRYIKLHLEFNSRILYYFGPNGNSLRGSVWNMEDIETVYGDRLLSSSNLSSVRGDTMATIAGGNVRYSGVFVDDAENEENTRTATLRDKIADNIMNGIYPAIEKNEPGCRLFLIETPVHYDSFAQRILDLWNKAKKEGREEEFGWKVITYGATQPDMPGGVLWHSWLPREKLDEIKATYVDSPRGIDGYYQEYELQVQSTEESLWSRNHIRYWNGTYRHEDGENFLIINGEMIPVNTFLGCDPATDIDTKKSDFSVIMVIAVDANNNIYVLEYERHKAIPSMGLRGKDGKLEGKAGVVDYIIDLYQKYHCASGTVEDVAMNRSIFQDLRIRLKELNFPPIAIIPEKPGGTNKINRIYSGLNGMLSSGSVYLRESHYDLINEILKFGPRMAHDDTIETLYYATRHIYAPKSQKFNQDAPAKRKMPFRKVAKSWIVA